MNAHPHRARLLGAAAGLVACAALAGCTHERAAASEPSSQVTITSAPVRPPIKTPQINISSEIVSACKIDLDAVKQPVEERAPHFAFDKYELQPTDDALLDQVAECLTKGPLVGRSIELIGRADPRGETEYNFVLGSHRSDSVAKYLESHGIGATRMQTTSRGELDATGTDEGTWAADRRVDIVLL